MQKAKKKLIADVLATVDERVVSFFGLLLVNISIGLWGVGVRGLSFFLLNEKKR